MASQFASQHHQVHYLQIISGYVWFPRQDFILLCACLWLSVIPYAFHCRLYSLFHLFNNADPNRALMVCYFNQVKQSQPKKSWVFFWTVLWQLHGLILKCLLILNWCWSQFCSSLEGQQNPITWCLISAISGFTILKPAGMQNHCQHHPVHPWTNKPINCVFWRE